MKVQNIVNARGNVVSNQFVMEDSSIKTFQSYDSKIAEYNVHTGVLTVYSKWDYSNTTMRHFKTFINDHTLMCYDTAKQWRKQMINNEFIKAVL